VFLGSCPAGEGEKGQQGGGIDGGFHRNFLSSRMVAASTVGAH
jgi:hypothetical protein